jgi:hypothetical protein
MRIWVVSWRLCCFLAYGSGLWALEYVRLTWYTVKHISDMKQCIFLSRSMQVVYEGDHGTWAMRYSIRSRKAGEDAKSAVD